MEVYNRQHREWSTEFWRGGPYILVDNLRSARCELLMWSSKEITKKLEFKREDNDNDDEGSNWHSYILLKTCLSVS